MATAQTTTVSTAAGRSSTNRGGIVNLVIKAIFWLLMSLLFSIVIEWIGLTFWWPEAGVQHSIDMYEHEIGYLALDLQASIFFGDPAGTAGQLSTWVHGLWQRSGLLEAIAWMGIPPPPGATVIQTTAYRLHDYAAATVFVTMTFALRIAILTLSIPVFALFSLIGLVDGLVERDLRRF